MLDKQKEMLRHLTGGRLSDEEFADLTNYIETYLMPGKLAYTLTNFKKYTQIAGKIVRDGVGMQMFFKVDGKTYPANYKNCEVMDAYLHTSDEKCLEQLEGQIE